MRTGILLLIILLLSDLQLSAQENVFESGISKSLSKHVRLLASDQMMGREAGGPGELPASRYIEEVFKVYKIAPGINGTYVQKFKFNDGAQLGDYNMLTADTLKFKLFDDFNPMSESAALLTKGKLLQVGFGIISAENDYDDYKDFTYDDLDRKIFVIELSSPDGIHPHSKYSAVSGLTSKIEQAVRKGAVGIIFVNSDENLDDPDAKLQRDIRPYDIPIIFAKGNAAKIIKADKGDRVFTMRVDINREEKTGTNIIAVIDNKADNSILIGAHYDHLGFGSEGSLERGKGKVVHNGADDNASGVALMLELAKYLKASGSKSYNYYFVAFTGEEKGLLGSNYYVKNPAIANDALSFMLNFDMVGRLQRTDPVLIINGVGTAKEFESLVNNTSQDNFRITTTESGIGPSDHTSFYLENVPVLHFFSGTHEDYHKSTDDFEKINFKGIVDIGHYMIDLINRTDASKKLEFVKTKDENIFKAPKFTVTLGVVPDYAFSEEGMRIDGVTEGKSASAAGMIKGDVVIKLGNYSVRDMTTYMEALSKFKKGDSTTVTFKREGKTKTSKIQF
ncbi:MAG: M20/M25/M40 family metallo-hydrolase [Bacteroidia bacterium]|nr:M20/M25/M40 family metallo-hydrolase [Bacteroidia bacterium]